MLRVVEYDHALSNVRLVQLDSALFEVQLSGRDDLKGAAIPSQAREWGLVIGSDSVRPANPSAIKTSFATSVAPVSLVPADFNGALIDTKHGNAFGGGRISITAAAQAGAYSMQPIVITRTDITPNVSDSIAFTTVDGGETITTTTSFGGLLSIGLPAMGSGLGSLQIGTPELREPRSVGYPFAVQRPTMESAIASAFKILKGAVGNALVKSLGRNLGPVEIFNYQREVAWGERLANLRWFGA